MRASTLCKQIGKLLRVGAAQHREHHLVDVAEEDKVGGRLKGSSRLLDISERRYLVLQQTVGVCSRLVTPLGFHIRIVAESRRTRIDDV